MKTTTLAFVAAPLALAAAAQATLVIGQPIIVPQNNTRVKVEFIGSDAGWTGVLHHIQSGGGLVPIFNNHTALPGQIVDLGVFGANDPVLFSYKVITGTTNHFRMDDPVGVQQFGYTDLGNGVYRMGVEDIKLPGGDRDYNDIEFYVRMCPVPAPGPVALAGLGCLMALPRRRKA